MHQRERERDGSYIPVFRSCSNIWTQFILVHLCKGSFNLFSFNFLNIITRHSSRWQYIQVLSFWILHILSNVSKYISINKAKIWGETDRGSELIHPSRMKEDPQVRSGAVKDSRAPASQGKRSLTQYKFLRSIIADEVQVGAFFHHANLSTALLSSFPYPYYSTFTSNLSLDRWRLIMQKQILAYHLNNDTHCLKKLKQN